MKTPTRPATVPMEADWDASDKIWQLGPVRSVGVIKKQKCPTGEWRYWRSDGSLSCIANFDDEGRQHGIVEQYHNDGSLASRGMWKHGNRQGQFVFYNCESESDVHYPASSATWRYEFESTANWEEKNIHWFLKDGTECTSDGRILADAYDLDTVIGAAQPETFLDQAAWQIANSLSDDEREAKTDPLHLEAIWGVTNSEIDSFVNNVAEGDSFSRADGARTFEENIWESLIAHPWENQHEELAAAFIGAAKIGYFGDSDHIYTTIFLPRRENPQPNAVFYWSHDTYHVDEVLSLSLHEFAYRVAIAAAFEAERMSPKMAAQAWKKLAGKACVGWGSNAGLDTLTRPDDSDDDDDDDDGEAETDPSEFSIDLDPKNSILGPFWRAQWIILLLTADGERNWDDISECFRPGWNKALTDEIYNSLRESGEHRLTPTALYLLWRLFWFNQQDKLKECCQLYRNHPARIVRDLVVLLEEIENGKEKIGGIKNIHEVRKQFLALDLSPEREGEREQEHEEQEAQANERAAAIAASKAELVALGLDAILEQAWLIVSDEAAIKELENIARTLPEFEMQWRCFDWVRDQKYNREYIESKDEAIEIGVWLSDKDCRVLQPFIWSAMQLETAPHLASLLLPAIGRAPGALDSRLLDRCLEQLTIAEKYNLKRTLAARILGLSSNPSTIVPLANVLEEFSKVIGEKSGFDATLEAIPWQDLLVETAVSLKKLADRNHSDKDVAIAALRKLLQYATQNHEHNIAVAALNALVDWDKNDILPFISKMLMENDTRVHVAIFRALEEIAPQLPDKERKNFCLLEFRNPDDNDNAVTLMYYRAAHALSKVDRTLGDTASMEDALEEARQLHTYGDDLWNQWRVVECETVGRFPQLDIDSIAHYLASNNAAIREAAELAYTARGVAFTPRKSVSWPLIWQATAEADSPESARLAVVRLLLDEETFDLSAPAVWLADNADETTAEAITKVVNRKLKVMPKIESGEYLSVEYQCLLQALAKHAKFESARTLLEQCLQSNNTDVQGAIVQNINYLPLCFAPQLLKIAIEDNGWQKYSIANWAIANSEDPAMKEALDKAGLTVRKLKNWSK